MKKYELIDEGTIKYGAKLYRIKALRDIGSLHTPMVKAGDLGGYVRSENNLSHEGECWIYDEGVVFGKALIRDNAVVMNRGQVSNCAIS